jgi:hypothetical protein
MHIPHLKLARVATRSNLFWPPDTTRLSGLLQRIRKNPTWRSGSRKDERRCPSDSLYVVNSKLVRRMYVIISVTYNLSLPTCTVHNAKTLPHHLWLPNITHMPTEDDIYVWYQSNCNENQWYFLFSVISANSFVPVLWSDLRYIRRRYKQSEKIPINISAREYQLMLWCKIIMSMIRPILCL